MSSEEDQALEKAREEKKAVIEELVKEKAMAETEFPGLMALGEGLKGGDSLETMILWSSQTNFAYRTFLKGDPTKAVFVKISFEYAMWNPDHSEKYNLSRTENEFKLVKRVAEELYGGFAKAPVVQPYYCLDLPGDEPAKVTITEWSPADDQFSVQFKEGKVDQRVLVELARALARLNLLPVEPEWNEDVRGTMKTAFPLFKKIFGEFVEVPDDQADVAIAYCKELGLEKLEAMIDALDDEMMNKREVLCHNDTKQFNILVMKREEPGQFDAEGKWAIVDWEMTMKGRSGRDVGIFHAFTIACAYCHAVQGNKKEAHQLLDCVLHFWNEYEMVLRKDGQKDDDFIADALRGSLGATFLYAHCAYYMLGLDREGLPLDAADEKAKARALGSLGKTSLQLGEIAYLGKFNELGANQLKMFMAIMLDGEIDALLQFSEGQPDVAPRRATMVVKSIVSGRRLSTDKHVMELASRRVSEMGHLGGRASVYALPSIPAELLELGEDDEDN